MAVPQHEYVGDTQSMVREALVAQLEGANAAFQDGSIAIGTDFYPISETIASNRPKTHGALNLQPGLGADPNSLSAAQALRAQFEASGNVTPLEARAELFGYDANLEKLKQRPEAVAHIIVTELAGLGIQMKEAMALLLHSSVPTPALNLLRQYLAGYGCVNFEETVTPETNLIIFADKEIGNINPAEIAAATKTNKNVLVFDADNVLTDEQIREFLALGWRVAGIGKGHIYGRDVKDIKGNTRHLAGLDDTVTPQHRPETSARSIPRAMNQAQNDVVRALEIDIAKRCRQLLKLSENLNEALDAKKVKQPADQRQLLARLKGLSYMNYALDLAVVDLGRGAVELLNEDGRDAFNNDLDKRRKQARGKRLNLPDSMNPADIEALRHAPIPDGMVKSAKKRILETTREELSDNAVRERLQDLFYSRFTAGGDIRVMPAVFINRGPDGKHLHVKVDPDGKLPYYSARFIMDVAQGKHSIPDEWVKYTVLVPLYVVDCAPEKVDESARRASNYFITGLLMNSSLSQETRNWLIYEVLEKGKILTTVKEENSRAQSKVAILAPVNPYADVGSKTGIGASGRAGVLVSMETGKPEVVVAKDEFGREQLIEIKGVGPLLGDRSPEEVTGMSRQIAGGVKRDASGKAVIGQTAMSQVHGLVRGGDATMIEMLVDQPAHKENGTPSGVAAAVFYSFRFLPGQPLSQVWRTISSTRRLGHMPMGGDEDYNPHQIASDVGWNTAEILAGVGSAPYVHIALGLDNIREGYFTDEDSLVDVANERDPRAAFNYYFDWTMRFVLHGYNEAKSGEIGTMHFEYFPSFMDGFLQHLFELPVVRDNPQIRERLLKYHSSQHQSPYNIEDFMDDVYGAYVAYRVFRARLENGYNPALDSAYTSNAGKKFRTKGAADTDAGGNVTRGSAYQEALEFLTAEEDLLNRAERAMAQDGYEARDFDFNFARNVIKEKRGLAEKLNQEEGDEADFRDIYKLGYYRARRSFVHGTVDVLSTRDRVESVLIGQTGALDKAAMRAALATAGTTTAQARATGEDKVDVGITLKDAVELSAEKLTVPQGIDLNSAINHAKPVFVTLTAGMGSRFGDQALPPKCAVDINGKPVGRYSIDAAKGRGMAVVSVVGHREDEVMAALGKNIYVHSTNPKGGTGFATYEIFSIPQLLKEDPLVVIAMGDKVMTPDILQSLKDEHIKGGKEAALTFMTAKYEGDRRKGKGRIVRDEEGRVTRIIEQKVINAMMQSGDLLEQVTGEQLDATEEGNCPLYVLRASTLHRYLSNLTPNPETGEYYLTDIIAAIVQSGGEIRTVKITRENNPDYDLLVSDVTKPADVDHVNEVLASRAGATGEMMTKAPAQATLDALWNWHDIPQMRQQLQTLSNSTDEDEIQRYADRCIRTINEAVEKGFTSMDQPIILLSVPGRVKPFGNACDYRGANFDSAAMATIEDNIFVVSGRDDGVIHLGTMYPEKFPNKDFNVHDFGLNPTHPIEDMNSWDNWFGLVPEDERPMPKIVSSRNAYWFAMPWAAAAWMRGAEPGKRDLFDGGFNLFVGDSELSSSGGLSSSSCIFVGAIMGLNELYDLGWSQEQLINAGFAERGACGTMGFTADHAAIILSRAAEIGRLKLEPVGVAEQITLPNGLHMFVIDTGIDREATAPFVSNKIASEDGNPPTEEGLLQAIDQVKKRGSIGAELGVLYFTHLLNGKIDFDNLRDLIGDGKAANQITEEEVVELLMKIPARISKEELMGQLNSFSQHFLTPPHERMQLLISRLRGSIEKLQFPPDGLRLRGLIAYFVSGAARVHEFFEAIKDTNIPRILEVVRSYHNGERVATAGMFSEEVKPYDGTPRMPLLWEIAGVRERSLEPLDYFIDSVEFQMQHKVALMVLAAGLGGQIIAFVPEDQLPKFLKVVGKNLSRMAANQVFGQLLDKGFTAQAEAVVDRVVPDTTAASSIRGLVKAGTSTKTLVKLVEQHVALSVKEYAPGEGATVISVPKTIASASGLSVAEKKALVIANNLEEAETAKQELLSMGFLAANVYTAADQNSINAITGAINQFDLLVNIATPELFDLSGLGMSAASLVLTEGISASKGQINSWLRTQA